MKRLELCLLLMLAACSKDGPPAPSAQQSAQLNDAETMLNSMSRNEQGANEEGPKQSSGPSRSSQ